MSGLCETCGQPMPGGVFKSLDWQAFSLGIRLAMARKNVSYRQLADIVGGDQSTITRVGKHGKPIRAEIYLALCNWMEEVK